MSAFDMLQEFSSFWNLVKRPVLLAAGGKKSLHAMAPNVSI